ncbi:hypothetical protein ABZ345_36235 [Lentzea sp. NPDC005914]|uniref:hypothetical protein n=1 Tax=Lentzea sp. NPDC005914 TaxID=3154572 RepID=UPI0033C738C3
MSIIRRLWAGSIGIMLGALSAAVLTAAPAQAATELGGVDMQRGCGSNYWHAEVYYPNQHVFGWRCTHVYSSGYVGVADIDVNAVCASQYGTGAYSGYLDYYNPYSWRCYR